jgi:hypothetical protein
MYLYYYYIIIIGLMIKPPPSCYYCFEVKNYSVTMLIDYYIYLMALLRYLVVFQSCLLLEYFNRLPKVRVVNTYFNNLYFTEVLNFMLVPEDICIVKNSIYNVTVVSLKSEEHPGNNT